MKNKKNYFSRERKLKEISILVLLISLSISIRSIHFSSHVNFSHDQGSFSSKVLDIYRNKSLTLIGPSISYIYQGREIFQGGIIYYILLLFLWIGNFNPIYASYLFMLFATCMLIPLFYGVKMLIGKNVAWLACIIYALFPFYTDYSRFLWNPNFQFALLPVLILLMGFYKKFRKPFPFLLIGIYTGFLLQFHYQFIVIIVGLIIYYFFFKKLSIKLLAFFICGFLIGLSPLVLFELRNNFYNTQTIWYFISHGQYFVNSGGSLQPHYLLSISLFVLLIILSILNKHITRGILIAGVIILSIGSILIYGRYPSHAFGMSDNWNYLLEEKAYKIIKAQNISNFNVANSIYDTKASVQKYLLKRDGVAINEEEYYRNLYLFVITTRDDTLTGDRAYEVESFRPSVVVNAWSLNSYYKLYLLKRTTIEN